MPPPYPIAADASARYNRRWGGRLLLVNTVLLCWLTMGDYLHKYFGPYAFWIIPALPAVLAALAALVAASLPKAERRPFQAAMVAGVILTLLGGIVAFWAANFLRGKW